MTIAVTFNKGFEHVCNFLLLTAGEVGCRFEKLTHLSTRSDDTSGPRFPKKFFNRDAKGFCHWNEDVGAGKIATFFPIKNIGVLFADLTGKLTNRESCSLSQPGQTADGSLCGMVLGHMNKIS